MGTSSRSAAVGSKGSKSTQKHPKGCTCSTCHWTAVGRAIGRGLAEVYSRRDRAVGRALGVALAEACNRRDRAAG